MSNYFYPPGCASAQQVGDAAQIRFGGNLDPADRNTLNQIIHSADANPHQRGHNPYADPTKSYDPKAQAAIDSIKAKQGNK